MKLQKSLYEFMVENEIFCENTEDRNTYYRKILDRILEDLGKDIIISRDSKENKSKTKHEKIFELTDSYGRRASFNDIKKIADQFEKEIGEVKQIIKGSNEINLIITTESGEIDKITLCGHGSKFENTNKNIEKQERVQLYCIQYKFTDEEQDKKYAKALMDAGLLDENDDIKTYVSVGIKTAKAWYNKFKDLNNLKFSYPTDSSGVAKEMLGRYKKFDNKPGNINEWNPADIYISTVDSLSDLEKTWFKDDKKVTSITDYNKFLKDCIIKKKLFPVSLKMNTSAKRSESDVELINVEDKEEKKSSAVLGQRMPGRKSLNGYAPVITSKKGIIINIILDGKPFSYCFRSFGKTYSFEAKNGKITDKEIASFNKVKPEYKDEDIFVRNLTSSLGKAKATLSTVFKTMKSYIKPVKDIDPVQLVKIDNEKKYPILYTITHDIALANNKCKDGRIIELFNAWINGMKDYIDSSKTTEEEALCYTKYAAEKRNYGDMIAFAPYVKIS